MSLSDNYMEGGLCLITGGIAGIAQVGRQPFADERQ